ncbi:MAG: hypothetical protein AABY79_04815 [Nitrospirota bacterium]
MTTMIDVIKKAMLMGLGAQEKAKEFVEELVKKGELSKSEGAKIVKEFVTKTEENTNIMEKNIKGFIHKAFEKMNLPTKDDLERLEKKVQALSSRVKKIEGGKEEETD